MNRIDYDRVVDENDLWKLFSETEHSPSETTLFFSQVKPLLKPMKFSDGSKLYHLFEHSTVPTPPERAQWRATVTQKNLWKVANAMSKACHDVAIQYVGKHRI
jgi:hypothetical protein